MSVRGSCRSGSVPFDRPPRTAASLARGLAAPFVVYERAGEWSCGSGALAEVV
ncbi:hypothetical protein [Parafrankia discariae]|uniref:hypothetical protein n=1 Tax=Parafrankia discariae TaxID=365528 RepID=UPI0003776B4A|nr:hypothetical protein [Parafrankia discariae]